MDEFIIEEAFVGKRLDEALFALGYFLSRTRANAEIKNGNILVNGKVEKPAYKLCISDKIIIKKTTKKPLSVEAEEMPLDIVYEDDSVIVINKPAGLVVHPGNGHSSGTLVNGLKAYTENLANADSDVRPGIVHRIDKDTSGLVCIAKTDEALLALSEQLKDHTMHREYLALVSGIIYENDGIIDAPIARDPSSPLKYHVDAKKGKESLTIFHVEKRFEKYTLVDCKLKTGRTHQIRVHMDYIGHPVIGDPLYGQGNRVLYNEGQLLHAYRLSFIHPKTKKEVTFEAPLPLHFKNILDNLK